MSFDLLPDDLKNYIFNLRKESMLQDSYKMKYNIVMEDLLNTCEDCLYFFGLINADNFFTEEELNEMSFGIYYFEFKHVVIEDNTI